VLDADLKFWAIAVEQALRNPFLKQLGLPAASKNVSSGSIECAKISPKCANLHKSLCNNSAPVQTVSRTFTMKRNFRTEKTCIWRGPICDKKPYGYHSLLAGAPDVVITVPKIELFVVEKPGLDKPVRSNSSRWWYEKLVTNNTVTSDDKIPHGVTVGDDFHYFTKWVSLNKKWKDEIAIEGGYLVITLQTDLYKMWDAIDGWTKYKQRIVGTVLDNGWYRHAVKLAARFQWWTLTGTENWHTSGSSASRIVTSRYFDGHMDKKKKVEVAEDEYEDREYDDAEDDDLEQEE